MYKVLPRDLMYKWVQKRKDDLFQREVGLMAPTSVLVANHREAEAKRTRAEELREDARELMRKVVALREEASQLEFQANVLESIKLTDVGSSQKIHKRCFAESCRGWLDHGLHCSVCDQNFCGRCHAVNSEHVCDPGQVYTVDYIEATSRPCPTCAAPISKIDGCDQMYCIVCDTAFSWHSGEVDPGFIHNPHYLRKMESGGHVPRASVSDELPPWRDLADLVPRDEELVRGFYAVVYDLLGAQQKLFEPVNNDYERAQFMINKISESKFKSLLHVKEKRWLLRREIAKSTDEFLRVGCRLFWQLLSGDVTLNSLREKIEEMRLKANGELLALSRRWERLCVPVYDETFTAGKQKWRPAVVDM